jgi:ABC-2 type transport system permease protein
MWNRVSALIWKELLAVLRDPKSRLAIFIPPLIQLFIFTFAATLDVKDVPIGIYNQDFGEHAIEMVQRLHGSPMFRKIAYLKGEQEIAPFLDNQIGLMVFSMDESFSRTLNRGQPAQAQLLLDGRRSNSAQIVSGYVSTIVEQFNEELAARNNSPQPNAKLFPINWFNPNLLYYWYNNPSLVATLSMLTCLIVTTLSVAREREMGTFDQLLVSPLVPKEILIGKIVPGVLIGMAEGIMMMLAGVFLLGVPFQGSFPLFLLSLLVFVAAISGVGLFISSLSATQQQAVLGTFVFMMPSVLLSGFATPIENMPSWLQPVAYLLPLTYMLVISKGIFLKAMPAAIVFENLWPLLLIGSCTLPAAAWLFRRRLT